MTDERRLNEETPPGQLELNRETVRDLTELEAEAVVGGAQQRTLQTEGSGSTGSITNGSL
jgi:hypothetical protein